MKSVCGVCVSAKQIAVLVKCKSIANKVPLEELKRVGWPIFTRHSWGSSCSGLLKKFPFTVQFVKPVYLRSSGIIIGVEAGL